MGGERKMKVGDDHGIFWRVNASQLQTAASGRQAMRPQLDIPVLLGSSLSPQGAIGIVFQAGFWGCWALSAGQPAGLCLDSG